MPKILGREYNGNFGSFVEEAIFEYDPDASFEEDSNTVFMLYRGDIANDLEMDYDLTDEEIEFLSDHADGGLIVDVEAGQDASFSWFKDSELLDEAWEDRTQGGVWEEGGDDTEDIEYLEYEEDEDEDEEDEDEDEDDDSESDEDDDYEDEDEDDDSESDEDDEEEEEKD